ncbi:MAG: hypothetical protein ACK5P5_10525 [Pseudobdellovibrionaceae bacterium]
MKYQILKSQLKSIGNPATMDPEKQCQYFSQLLSELVEFEKSGELDLICKSWPDQLLFEKFGNIMNDGSEAIAALSVFSTALRARILTRTIADLKFWFQILDRLVQMTSDQDKNLISFREAKVRLHLAMASYYRNNEQPLLSLLRSKKALLLTNRDSFLRGETLYVVALSLSLLGRSFDCLSVYMQATKIATTTTYRRKMCAMNEAHERIILSDLEGVRAILPELPIESSFRLQLQLELIEGSGNIKNYRSSLKNLKLLPSESGPCLLLLIEDALLAKEIDINFLREAFGSFKQHPFWIGTKFCAVLSSTFEKFLAGEAPTHLSGIDRAQLKKSLQIKDYIDLILHRTLCSAALGMLSMADWSELNELIMTHRMFTPLIPIESQCINPRFPWHKRFAERLGIFPQANQALLLDVPARRVLFGNIEIDLSKQPKTLDLLQALFELQPVIQKERLHQHLSGSKYVSHLHDQRLRMLLSRLREKIQLSFGVDMLHLPGDNLVHLKIAIQLLRRISS